MSDLHLGFRAYAAVKDGRNAREQDVEVAFARAVDRTIDAQPDLVTIAGDVFHNTRPSFHAVRALQVGIRRLVDETAAHVVIILGNHESPRTAEALSPVVVVEGEQRVHVVDSPKRIRLHCGDQLVSVACLPFVALAAEERYALEPDPEADVNVLLVHAAVRSSAAPDALPVFYAGETALDVGREADRWDVIAAGDYHEFTRLHPTGLAFYSGSIERTSSNIWPEAAPKGVVLYDTAARTMELLPISTRRVLDFTVQDVNGYEIVPQGAGAVNMALAQLAEQGIEDAILRLKVDEFDRAERQDIDFALVRQLKERALHFQLDLRFAEREHVIAGDRHDRAVRTLQDEATDFLEKDPAPVRECALAFLGGEA
jgi:DNA repair exonuclease SbcCD nuclease subunit